MTRSDFIARIRENVANNVRYHRYQLGLNQEDMAAHAGMAENRIYILENPGKGNVTLDALSTLAHVLDLKVADLVAFREPVPPRYGIHGNKFFERQRRIRNEQSRTLA